MIGSSNPVSVTMFTMYTMFNMLFTFLLTGSPTAQSQTSAAAEASLHVLSCCVLDVAQSRSIRQLSCMFD
jgi:hypothetical protein